VFFLFMHCVWLIKMKVTNQFLLSLEVYKVMGDVPLEWDDYVL